MKFKTGDKVKIPTKKTYGKNIEKCKQAFGDDWEYLLVLSVSDTVNLEGPTHEKIHFNSFYEVDLEMYSSDAFKYNIGETVVGKEGGYYFSNPEAFDGSHRSVFGTGIGDLSKGKKIEDRKNASGYNWYKLEDYDNWRTEEGIRPLEISSAPISELLEEAKRRYPIGTKFYPAHVDTGPPMTVKGGWRKISDAEIQCIREEATGYSPVLYYGKEGWARIHEEAIDLVVEVEKATLYIGTWYRTIGDQFKTNKYIKFAGLNDKGQVTFTERVTQDGIYEVMANNTRPNPAGCTSINSPEKSLQEVPDSEIEQYKLKKPAILDIINTKIRVGDDIELNKQVFNKLRELGVTSNPYRQDTKYYSIGNGGILYSHASTSSFEKNLNREITPEFLGIVITSACVPITNEEKWVVGGYVRLLKNQGTHKKGDIGKISNISIDRTTIWIGFIILENAFFTNVSSLYTPECEWFGMNLPLGYVDSTLLKIKDSSGDIIRIGDHMYTGGVDLIQQDEDEVFNEKEFLQRPFNKKMEIQISEQIPEIKLKF